MRRGAGGAGMLLEGKWAVVTGSNRGIGRAILSRFAENGASVFAHSRKPSAEFEEYCEALAKERGVRVIPVYFDARDSGEMKGALREVRASGAAPDILVNNLGAVRSVKLFQMTGMEELREEFEVNFFSQMEFTQGISRMMVPKRRGSIINISSCAPMEPRTGMLPYVSSKSAVIGATRRLAIELGQYGIRVNSVAPGLTETDMAGQMQGELERQTIGRTVFGRKAKPEEVADAAVFFASDLSAFVTGQVLRVDGGLM